MAKYIKTIKFDTEVRNKLSKGMEVVATAVGSTLGPRGRNVAIDITPNYDVPPTVVHDGVTVAKSINLEDVHEDMGVRLLKAAAMKTNQVAGDGTTTSTILAYAIVREALKAISSGVNPMQIKQEIEEAAKFVVANLQKLAVNITKYEEKEQIATISSADPEIGKLVAESLEKVGKEGVITVEEGKTLETTVDYKQGMEIDKGYMSTYFITDQERGESVIEDPYILITDRNINYTHEILPLLENFTKETGSKNLVIFAGALIEEAMGIIAANKIRGVLNICAIQSPAFGTRRADELEDIATLTGGTTILADSGRGIASVIPEELGRADKVIANRERTIILNGRGDKKAINKRIEELRKQLVGTNTDFDKEIKNERLAKLAGKIAVINVGATTEVEVKEKKERVIDAVAATKAAVEEGIVAGGEITLLKLASEAAEMPTDGFSIGRSILLSALKEPFKKLLENAGIDYAEALQKLHDKPYPYGIDVIDGQVKDMIKTGIIDPVLVTRSALQNAISIASMTITTSCLITDVPSEDLYK